MEKKGNMEQMARWQALIGPNKMPGQRIEQGKDNIIKRSLGHSNWSARKRPTDLRCSQKIYIGLS